jgi:hypothetical protein
METAIVVRFYAFLSVIFTRPLRSAPYRFGNCHRIAALEFPGIA